MKKFFISIGLCMFTIAFTNAQTSAYTSYYLFFHKGQKIKPNVLLTPEGDTVFYNPIQRTLKKVSKAEPVTRKAVSGKELDDMLAEINKTPQRKNEMMQKLIGSLPKPVVPYYAQPLKESYDEAKEVYISALSNEKEISKVPYLEVLNRTQLAKIEYRRKLDITKAELLKALMEYVNNYKNTPVEIPAPPAKEYHYCSQRDAGIRTGYKKAVKEFWIKLRSEEDELISKIFSYEHYWNKLGEAAPEDGTKLDSAIKFVMRRLGQKAKMLVANFGNDPLRHESVIAGALSIERTRQLMGIEPGADGESLEKGFVDPIMKNVFNRLITAMNEYDYTLALSTSFMLGTMREYAMLGGKDKDYLQGGTKYEKALRFNRFKLDIKVSGRIEKDGGGQLADLNGKNYFAAMPDPEDTLSHKLKWILLGPDPEAKHMKFDLTDAKAWGLDKQTGVVNVVTYAGTKKWQTIPPKLRIDFCDKGIDTAMVFQFEPDGEEIWIAGGKEAFPKVNGIRPGIMQNILTICFIDEERMRAEYTEKMNKEKLKKLEAEGKRFQERYASGQMPSQSEIDKMMKMSKALTSGSLVSEMILWGHYLVIPGPQNKNKIVFKDRIDGKQLFAKNTAIEHATFDISMENDPDSK